MLSRGELEDRISKELIKFEKEHLGRGPREVRTFILEDMILVRLKGILTPAEKQLARSEEGQKLIKKIRVQLIETSRELLEEIISGMTGCTLVSLHTDISTTSGERIFVFVLDRVLFDE